MTETANTYTKGKYHTAIIHVRLQRHWLPLEAVETNDVMYQLVVYSLSGYKLACVYNYHDKRSI